MKILSAALVLVILALAACQAFVKPVSAEVNSDKSKEVTAEKTPKADGKEYDLTKIKRSDAEWRKQLSRNQYRVTRKHDTERARSGRFWNNKKDGVYVCICCDLPLFDSETKFVSGTGWPSFYQPINKKHVGTQSDNTLFMRRTEVHCKRCDAHLGHVFDDGPRPTGLRYCINSASLDFKKASKDETKDADK